MRYRLLIFSLTVITIHLTAVAQNGGYSLFRSFTVADGLPSNHIYTSVEDNKGFLWVATDAGIARFDGKHFQIFTTRDGLPDDDVLDVVKENNGRIWVNCFKQSPAYFDEVRNRFINSKEDTSLAKVKGTTIMNILPLTEGGVMYYNENGSWLFQHGILTNIKLDKPGFSTGFLIQKNEDGSFITFNIGHYTPMILQIKNGKIIDTVPLENCASPNSFHYLVRDNRLFIISDADARKYYVYTAFQTSPLRIRLDSVSIGEPVFWQGFTANYFNVISKNGIVHVLDKDNFRHLFQLSGNYSPNSLYNDSKENIWISTVDKGLILYKKKQVEIFPVPDNFTNTHFLSIARRPDGTLLAGNFNGQIIETNGKYFITHQLSSDHNTNWQRKILILQNKVFSFSEGGDYQDFNHLLLNATGLRSSSKTAEVFNDSLLIEGNYGRLSIINTHTGMMTVLPSFMKRTTCIAITKGEQIYHGSTDGLYKFDYNKRTDDSLSKRHPMLGERITSICSSPDIHVWVGTASSGLFVLRNDSLFKIFSVKEGIISNNIKCITAGRPGEIWVGSNSGIGVIRYMDSPDDFTYQNLTINDGLPSNIINEMLYNKDTIYCATGNGICAIPANINITRFDIPVRLTGVVINNNDTVISDKYRLKYDQNNIELHFAGIELGGHFNYFQYRINNNDWQKLDANTLNLQLNSGSYTIYIRAVDVNGNAGTKPLVISFTISTPFWKAIWFWLLITLVSGGLIIGFLRKREMVKREVSLQAMLNQKKLTELELQALKSQINPHFIFNCLNSIKLLSHQQKHAEAEKYLDNFAALLHAALEQSSLQQISLQQEIHFLENYLSLEKLRFPDKLNYTIEIDKSLHPAQLLIPSMLLQPYIENAVKHGVAPLRNRQGLVQIRFYQKNNALIAEVQDNGNGIEKENHDTKGTGIGMENTARRSKLYDIETRIVNLRTVGVNLKGTLVQLTMSLLLK